MLDSPSQFDLVDPACPVNWSDPLTRGLVGWWGVVPNCGWSGSNLFRDLVRGGKTPNDGTLTNMAFPPTVTSGWQGSRGRPGGFGSLAFDGLDDYVGCGTELQVGTGDFSASVWFRTTSSPSIVGLVSNRNSSVTTNPGFSLYHAGNILRWIFCDGSATRISRISTAPIVNDGNWHFATLSLTRSGSGELFVDGAAATSGSASISAQPGDCQSSEVLSLGRGSSEGLYFAGNIDCVIIRREATSLAKHLAMFSDSLAGHPRMLNWVQPRRLFFSAQGPFTTKLPLAGQLLQAL